MEKILHDKKGATAALSVSLRTLDYLVAAGELKPIRCGRKVLFRHSDLEAFSRKNHHPRTASGSVAAEARP